MSSTSSWKVKLEPINTDLHGNGNTTASNTNTGDGDETSSLGSGHNGLVQYFYEPSDERVKHSNLKRFSSNRQLRASFDENEPQGLLTRQRSIKGGPNGIAKTPTHSRRLSWMSANTYDLSQPLLNIIDLNEMMGEKFKILLRPPKFDRDDLLFSIHTFMSSIIDYIPAVKLDKTYQIFKNIRQLLKSSECLRLYGLLIHFCYWNIIHPAARNAIKEIKYTHKRRNSFMDIQLQDGSQFLMQLAQSRVGLLPEILEEEQEHHMSYDEENISPKHRSYSFMIVNQMNQGIPIQSSLHNASRTSVMSAVTFTSSASSNSVGGGAKTIDQLDDIFNKHLENIGEEEEDELSMSTVHTTSTGTGGGHLAIIQSEQTTNIPFTPSNRNRSVVDLEADEHDGDKAKHSHSFQNSALAPWLTGDLASVGGGDGSLAGVSLSSETSLTFHEREQLFIQLETCITSLFKKMGRGKFALVTGRQALISCCHFIVDDILTAMYPWFAQVQDESNKKASSPGRRAMTPPFSTAPPDAMVSLQGSLKELNLRLRRLVHQSVSDLIDPSRIYTSSMLLNLVLGLGTSKSIKEVTRKAKELLENENHGGRRGKYYRTSAAVLALFGDSKSPLARKFLQRSATLYTQIPGAVEPFVSKLDNVGEWEEPLEYFNTVQMEEMKDKELKEIMKITDRQKDLTEVQRIAKRLAQSSMSPTNLPLSPTPAQQANSSFNQFPLSPLPAGSFPTAQFRSPSRLQHSENLMDSSVFSRTASRQQSRQHSRQQSRPSSKQGGGASSVAEQEQKNTRKPLDFLNLFKDQPEADFFPGGRTGNNHRTATGMFSPPKNRSRSSSPLGSPIKNKPQSPNSSPLRNYTIDAGKGGGVGGRKSTPDEDDEKKKRFTHRKTKKNVHKIRNSLFFGATTTTGTNLHRTSTTSAVGYVSNEESLTLQSLSVESESVASLANNAYAELPISLNAKTALMNLMVGKTTKLYSSRMQTNQTRQRIALLQGDDISFLSSSAKSKKKDQS